MSNVYIICVERDQNQSKKRVCVGLRFTRWHEMSPNARSQLDVRLDFKQCVIAGLTFEQGNICIIYKRSRKAEAEKSYWEL